MSIERARRDLSIDTIIRKKRSLYTEIFPFLSTSGLPKSVTMLVERHNVFQPITNALLNTATSTVTDVVNKGTTALTNKVAEKTNNPHLNDIAKAVAKTGTDIGKKINEKITESASVLS